jgi:hypothetical protein
MGMLQVRMDDKLLKTLDGRAIECGLDRSSYVKLVLTISKITSEVVRQCTDKDGKKEIVYDNVLHPVNDNVVQQSINPKVEGINPRIEGINPKVEALKSNPKIGELLRKGLMQVGEGGALVDTPKIEVEMVPTEEVATKRYADMTEEEKEVVRAKWSKDSDVDNAMKLYREHYKLKRGDVMSSEEEKYVRTNLSAINNGLIKWEEERPR